MTVDIQVAAARYMDQRRARGYQLIDEGVLLTKFADAVLKLSESSLQRHLPSLPHPAGFGLWVAITISMTLFIPTILGM